MKATVLWTLASFFYFLLLLFLFLFFKDDNQLILIIEQIKIIVIRLMLWLGLMQAPCQIKNKFPKVETRQAYDEQEALVLFFNPLVLYKVLSFSFFIIGFFYF